MKSLEKLFLLINIETTIITPNRRLAARLHQLYEQHQLHEELHSWETPDILPMISWLQRLYILQTSINFNHPSQLLNASQEQFIWEKIVLADKLSNHLLQVTETADTARAAYNLLHQWQVNYNDDLFKQSEDYLAFSNWAKQFDDICQSKNYVSIAHLPSLLLKLNSVPSFKRIILFGFTQLSPQLLALLSYLEKNGVEVIHYKNKIEEIDSCKIACPDIETEILTMANWAKKTKAENINAFIGCVIPSLDKIRDRVMQLFSQVFRDENTLMSNTSILPFNISVGRILTHYPIIKCAFELLMAYKKIVSQESLSYILRSPYLGDAESEYYKRACYEVRLREANLLKINFLQLLDDKDTNANNTSLKINCPRLYERLQSFFYYLEENRDKKTYIEWTNCFIKLLQLLGWPGERSLNSEEFQVVEQFLSVLNEYQTLDIVSNAVTFDSALHTLIKVANKTYFQPKTPEASIQVLGVLEAAALPFDFLWVSGLDDITWPPQPQPNPFIPKRLQRELQLPHSTALRELSFCSELMQQFKESSGKLIFSFAEKNEELETNESPLIRHEPLRTMAELQVVISQSVIDQIFQNRSITYLYDEMAPAYPVKDTIKGGINIIKYQALCPFKAFAEWRLHAKDLEKPCPGLRAKDRGTILHKALELVWADLKDHETLHNRDESSLESLIDESINLALHKTPVSHRQHKKYIDLEKKRLSGLINSWLSYEKSREPFEVHCQEKKMTLQLNNLNLSFRIDRVDKLINGKKLIIDYKTGKNNQIHHWFDERPEEPQLPLYSLLDPDNTIGISYAEITKAESGFKGVSAQEIKINGIKVFSDVKKNIFNSWRDLINQWQMTLAKLGDDFTSGVAKVNPKAPTQTCLWCALKPLCRINEEIEAKDDINAI